MASDGSIRIDIIIDGQQITAASAALAALAAAANSAGGSTNGLTQETTRASSGIRDMAISIGLIAVASKAFDILKSALAGAISRFDTLVGFPVIMEQMGFSSEQATNSINKLSDGIQGLPTTLDGIVKNTQGIAILTGDLDTATETTLALNNAFLASGSNAANAERGLTQYVQMLSKGQVDMMSWRTLQETMGYALKETATAFDLANPNELYAALKEGDISFDAFNAKLIELNGGVGGFAELAKTSSAGIATSMGNLKNTVVVGVANMIISFDNLSKTVTGKSIAENLDGLKVIVKAAFKVMGAAIEGAAPVVIVFASAIKSSIPVVQALIPAIIGLAAAFVAFKVSTAAFAAVAAGQAVLALTIAQMGTLTLATNAQVAARVLMTTTDRAGNVMTVANTGAVTLQTLVIGVLSRQITLAAAAVAIKTAATIAWGAAIQFALGPIGWITLGIGLLVAGVVALVSWFNKSTAEGERLTAVTDAMSESTSALNETLNGTSAAHENNLKNIQGTAAANTDLIAKIEELAAIQGRSGAQTKELNEYISQLNGSVDGLGLAFDKETNSLSMSSEQMAARITLMKEEETLAAAKERALAISKEQYEVESKMAETNELRAELNLRIEEGGKAAREAKDELEKLDESEAALKKTSADLATQQTDTAKQVTASVAAVATAVKNSVDDQLRSYASLEDEQKDIVNSLRETWLEYTDQASEMFTKLSEKSTVSIKTMNENMASNQRVMAEWADNIAILVERGLDEGLIDQLREAGPESAGHVKAIVAGSDTELKKMNALFAEAGSTATKTLGTSLGVENKVVMDSVGHLVTQTGDSLTAQIKKADFESLGKAIPKGTAGGVTEGTKDVVDATKKMATETEKAFKGAMDINSPSGVFKKDGIHITEGVALGITDGTPKVVTTMNKLVDAMLLPFANISAEFQKIGGFAGSGLDEGLKNSQPRVMATARNLANNVAATMRSALDTHSPSKVTTKIGKDTGDGLAVGIESTKDTNKKAVSVIGAVIKEAAKKNANEIVKIDDENEKKRIVIKKEYAEKRAELDRKSDQSAQTALKTSKNKKGEIVTTGTQRVHNIRADASAKLIKLNDDEQKKLAAVNNKAYADMQKVEGELSKAKLEAVKQFVADKKSLEKLSVLDEVAIWKEAVESFKKGTKEKITSQIEYGKALDTVNKEITSINKKYADEMQKINDNFKKQEEDLTKKYQTTLDGRIKALYSFAGTFDEFDTKVSKSGAELLKNLGTQVDGFKKWQFEIERLAKRAIDDGLIAELTAMGPKALGELMALNSLTDEQLTEYSALYQEKSALARTQAEAELIGMKEDTEKQIGELRKVANTELTALQSDWQKEIKVISNTTSKELSSLKQIGVDSIRGLLDGLNSMHPELLATAKNIADSVSGTIKKALDIHSPSRVLFDLGVNTVEGFINGIDSTADKSGKSADSIAQGVISRMGKTYEQLVEKTEGYYDRMKTLTASHNFEMGSYNRLMHEEIEDLTSMYGEKGVRDEKLYSQSVANISAHYLQLRTEQEEGYLKRKQEAYKESGHLVEELQKETERNMIGALKATLDERREANKITAIEEMKIWKSAADSFAESSQLKQVAIEHAKDAHVRALEEIRKQEEKITDEYEKALGDRTKSIASFSSVFDEFVVNSGKSGQDLLANLKSQVDGFQSWQKDITALSKRAIDEGLIAELKAMGPKAASEIAALNAMTNKQLTEYSKLYQDKQALARKQAETELVGLRDDTEKRLGELRGTVQVELDEINEIWKESSVDIVADMDKELSKLGDIGKSAGESLLAGLTSTDNAIKDMMDAQREYQQKANAEMITINRYYADEMKVINDDLIKQESDVTAEYERSVDARAHSIASFAGVFDEFKIKTGKTGTGLLDNLKSQVDGFKSWQESITELSARAIDDGLMAELRGLGPKAAEELAALNTLTDEQLSAYSALYQEKQALARGQAEAELIGMKGDAEKRIDELRVAANEKLESLKSDWNTRIKEITAATNTELEKLEVIGQQAGQGLLDGLASMEGAIVAKAVSIAEGIKGAMSGALDIHSPSRWMRDYLVGNMTLGFIKGVDKNKTKVANAASRFGDLMKPELNNVAIPNVNIRPFNPTFGGGGGRGSSSTDNRKTVTNKIDNHFTPAESTPSESARKQEQMLRRLAMEFN